MSILSKRLAPTSALKNQRYLKALKYFEDMQVASAYEISDYLDQSPSAGRNMIRDFVNHQLIEFDHFEKIANKGGGKGTAYYKVLEGASDKAALLFPIEGLENRQASRLTANGQHLLGDEYRSPQPLTKVDVHRDPLVAALYGDGRAPSLNFIDSSGGQDAQSQTISD